jgi:hypothetical protein
MKTFVTMGPGTNHDLVARRYLAFHGLGPRALSFVDRPEQGAERVLEGKADYLILCSVHADAPAITGRHFRSLFIVDTFISSSKPLAVVTRKDVARPRRLGLLAPTRDYIDTAKWSDVIVEPDGSIVQIWERLLAKEFDSALVYLEYAEQFPDLVVVDREIGSPDDAWLVFGRVRASDGGLIAHKDSAVGRSITA